MKQYNLYLDESETHSNNGNRHFCIAGLIVEDGLHDGVLTNDLNNLKNSIWSTNPNPESIILHEKDIKAANNGYNNAPRNGPYAQFRNNNQMNALYSSLNHIFVNNDVKIIAVSISEDKLNSHYPAPLRHQDKWTIVLQLLMENFTHFLQSNDGKGQVIYEYIGEAHKREMRKRFYNIKSMGTMYISPYEIQTRLMGICFPEKSENITGLQLADFLPNDIARSHAGFRRHNSNIYTAIRRKAYDGNIGTKNRFGIKLIP